LNKYAEEKTIDAGSGWTAIEFEVEETWLTTGDVFYVKIANWTSNDTLCIDMMTWTPAGSHVEPTDDDAAVITDLAVGDGGFSFAFMPDPRFAYRLHGTNELTAALSQWPVILTTNGSEKISFTLPVEASEPKMFYYLETTAK
jgi:hypothetical protein